MNFNLFNSLILAGIIQGFLFGGVWLFTKKYRAKSTYFLIALILVYSLSNLQYYLLDTGLVTLQQFYSYLYISWPLLMPALFLFYGGTLLDDPFMKRRSRYWPFYIPFIIGLVLGLVYKFEVIVIGKRPGFSAFFDASVSWGELLAIVYSLVVLVILLIKLNRQEKQHLFSPKTVRPQLKWFKILVIFQIFSTLLWAYSELMYADSGENYYFYPLWIVLSIIIYWMGHVGIYKYGITQERKKIRAEKHLAYSVTEPRSRKSDTVKSLEHFIVNEKNYLDPQLTLEKTAERLQISKGHLSKLINLELQQSFKEYLNNLRVEEAKSYLLNPDFSNYTLVSIGLEAGFNSKSAFNASFKKMTGVTPSQFKSQVRN